MRIIVYPLWTCRILHWPATWSNRACRTWIKYRTWRFRSSCTRAWVMSCSQWTTWRHSCDWCTMCCRVWSIESRPTMIMWVRITLDSWLSSWESCRRVWRRAMGPRAPGHYWPWFNRFGVCCVRRWLATKCPWTSFRSSVSYSTVWCAPWVSSQRPWTLWTILRVCCTRCITRYRIHRCWVRSMSLHVCIGSVVCWFVYFVDVFFVI